MRKKRRFYQSTIGIIILSIIALLIVFWFLRASLIASYVSHKLGVEVSIGSIKVSSSGLDIRNFKINNPIGARTNTAFSSRDIDVRYQWGSLRANPGIIDDIELAEVFLGIELYNAAGTRNNWTQIINNIAQEKDKDSKEVIIRRLVITNLSVHLRGKGLLATWKKVKEIPRIEFRNISSKDGFPTEQLIREIFDEANLETYIREIIKQPTKVIDKIFSPFTTPKKQ